MVDIPQSQQPEATGLPPSTEVATRLSKQMPAARILFISTTFPPIIGGSAIVYENLCRSAQGAIVALAANNEYETGNPLTGAADYDRRCEYPIYRVKMLHMTTAIRRGRFAALWSRLSDLLLMTKMLLTTLAIAWRERINVVCLGDLVYGGWLVFPLKYLFRFKIVFYIHGEEITTRSGALFDEWRAKFLNHADAIVSVSNFTRQSMTRLMHIDPAKITVIANGVNLERFQVRVPAPGMAARYGVEGKRVLLTVGRLVSRKGMDRLVEAMPLVLRDCPKAHLLIAGEGPLRATLNDLIRTHNLAEHVTLLGAVSDEVLSDLYAIAEIFALPNRDMPDGDTEGFGLVFLEANASGKPVVAGRAGGAVDAVTDGVNGLSIDGTDINAIAGAILRLLNDPVLYDKLVQGGLQVTQRGDWRTRSAEFVALCSSLLLPNGTERK